jgi:hypothetical protein
MTREFEIEKIERYYITAESEAKAIEKINDLDNSAASSVDYRLTWAGPDRSV